jgi:succinate dehydrogenase / fumarate reductase membrane anchor subunit
MVKSVLGVNHQGLQDWLIQRVSAVIMAIYSIGMISYFLIGGPIEFVNWHALFAHVWMKIATILCVASLLFHAWVGMWTIFTDYVKPYGLTIVLNVLVFFSLVASFFWALLILWGV